MLINSRIILKAILTTSLVISGTGLYLSYDVPVEAAKTTQASSTLTTSASTTFLKPKWQTKTDGVGLYDSQAPISNGLIYYSSGGTLIAANISTGKVKWTYKNGSQPEIVTNSSIFFINNNGYLVKASAKTGKLIWQVKAADAPIEIGAHAELRNGVLYFTNESGGISAYNPISGKKKWENKELTMYAGSIVGEYDGVLVVSSTVDNIRTQFFGLDPATGKKLWRAEGIYSFVAYREDQLILRQQSDAAYGSDNTPDKGYMITVASLDVKTGKFTKKENYNHLDDISRLGNSYTSLQGSYVYTVDGNIDNNEAFLNRFKLGQDPKTAPKSYKEFGDWLAGPTNGMVFFQKGTEMIGVNLKQDSVVTFDSLSSPVLNLQQIGKGVYTGLENGYFYIMNASTGKTLAKVKTGAKQFGKTFVVNGNVVIQTENEILMIELPKELK